jgi:dCTP diphosphatase
MSSELEDLLNEIQMFSDERDWDQFHTLKNLILALVGEVGELAEIVQWKTDSELAEALKTTDGKNLFSEEIADVAIYLLRLCQKADLDIIEVIKNKLIKNELKYPIDKSRGTSKKYNELS